MFSRSRIIVIVLSLCILYTEHIHAQNCDSVIENFKGKIINNYAGFSENSTKESFLIFIDKLKNSKIDCVEKLKQIQFYFQDIHLGIYLYNQPLRYFAPNKKPIKDKGREWIEGIWINERMDKLIRITKVRPGNFEGVVLSSPNKKLSKGLVLYEMKMTTKDVFQTKVNTIGRSYFGLAKRNNHSELIVSYFDKWRKVTIPEGLAKAQLQEVNFNPTLIKSDSETVLIKVPECSFEAAGIIDSLVKANKQNLNRCTNIIIDLRENSGGTILALEMLLPYLGLTANVSPGASMICSEDNILSYEKDLEYLIEAHIQPHIINQVKAILDSLKSHRGGIYYRLTDFTTVIPFWEPSEQKKIGVIVNYRTASAAELFILKAMRSRYVTLFGELTAGALYTLDANSYFSSDSTIEITIPMVKKDLRGINKLTSDFKIIPDFKLSSTDWISETKQYLKRIKL